MKKFNKDKYLKKLKLKRFWQNNSRYFYIGVPCILCGILGIYFAYSKFFVTQEQEVVKATVAPFIRGDVVINNYVNGQLVDDAPARGTGYKVDKIVCDNGAVGEWSGKDWGPIISNVTKRSKCNIYFVDVEKINIGNVAVPLDDYGLCPTVNADGTATVTEAESQYGYLCSMKDAYGTSYYYRGNITNNYVLFGGFYWRIIRINGDGTVRVIYDGTSIHANGESSSDRQIASTVFNNPSFGITTSTYNAHVGYMYGATDASTYAAAHANSKNSTIKTNIDNWYENNIKGTTNEQYIADNIFCNDRSLAGNNTGTGAGTSESYYRWYNMPWISESYSKYNNKMMLTCPQKNDAFTVNDTSKGNSALTYGVGLVTADEIVLAGGWNSSNSNYYLYSGTNYWTMSPGFFELSGFNRGAAFELILSSTGSVSNGDVSNGNFFKGYGARPVFNLKSEVLAQGSGTVSDPYHIAS